MVRPRCQSEEEAQGTVIRRRRSDDLTSQVSCPMPIHPLKTYLTESTMHGMVLDLLLRNGRRTSCMILPSSKVGQAMI